MSKPIEWAKLALDNWKIVLLFLPFLGYSGFNLKNDIDAYNAKSEPPSVTVNIEAQPESETDITPLIRQITSEAIKSAIGSHIAAEH